MALYVTRTIQDMQAALSGLQKNSFSLTPFSRYSDSFILQNLNASLLDAHWDTYCNSC